MCFPPMSDKYTAKGNPEGEYPPGSGEQVLRNKPGITGAEEMDDLELELLEQLYDSVIEQVQIDQMITSAVISEWHRRWFGNVYEWAGKLRSVNVSKGDFHFAASMQLPRLMKELDKDYLGRYTPCNGMTDAQLVEAIAIVHVEFVLIHPFREGNGRIARLLADVMALQANKPELDFSFWDAERDSYFLAIQAGLSRNYGPMVELVRRALLDGEKTFLNR